MGTLSFKKTVGTAAWTSQDIFIVSCIANNAATTQQNFARSDEAFA